MPVGNSKHAFDVEGSPEPPMNWSSYADRWRDGQHAITENQRVDRRVCRYRVLRAGRTRGCFRRKRQRRRMGVRRRKNRYEQGRI